MSLRIFSLCMFLLCGGCSTTDYDPYVAATDNQLKTRSYQTRDFGDVEYKDLLHAVISTLQDHHFRIRELDSELGTLTAYQHSDFNRDTGLGGHSDLSVFIKPRGKQRYAVRMNMATGLTVVNEAELYQQFFDAVRKKIYYTQNT
jgi:hypothetical protein